ncbi:tetratricopeptide repeat protein [Singulisphaera sp. Ch08]|uniref:Tetratricopeptide repeat protein n=1 Tax=Singulisphaera sp. Ch08 TaxID=3120278 RepID=A0AAU7CNF8_9BACT
MSHATKATQAEIMRENEAVVSARQRLELQKQAVGEHHPDYATGLNQLAMLMIMHGDPDRSEPLLRQALEIRKEALGERHPDYATNLSSLAGLLWARGDLDGAEPLMRQALDIRWDVLGSNHPKTTSTLNSLEQLLRAKQDWDGAERLVADPSSASPPLAPVAEAVAAAPAVSASAPVDVPAEPPAVEPIAPPAPIESVFQEPPAMTAPVGTEETREETASPQAWEPSADRIEPRQAEPEPVVPRSEVGGVEARPREELVGRQETLAAQFARVGERLAQEAEDWKAGGAPPTPTLIEELDVCGREFEQLRSEVVRLADSLGAAVEPSSLTNLEEIANLLQTLSEAEGRQAQLGAIRAQALARLDRVLTLAAADGKELAPLAECQAKARAERAAIADAPVLELPDEATQLAEGDHPYHALLTLVEGDGLSDDLWASSLESVEAAFGKALSVAVARSKIVQL